MHRCQWHAEQYEIPSLYGWRWMLFAVIPRFVRCVSCTPDANRWTLNGVRCIEIGFEWALSDRKWRGRRARMPLLCIQICVIFSVRLETRSKCSVTRRPSQSFCSNYAISSRRECKLLSASIPAFFFLPQKCKCCVRDRVSRDSIGWHDAFLVNPWFIFRSTIAGKRHARRQRMQP